MIVKKQQLKEKYKKALLKLEENEGRDQFLDGRPYELGELFDRISAKEILDYAQRLPKIKMRFLNQSLNFNQSILQNKFECTLICLNYITEENRVKPPQIYPQRGYIFDQDKITIESQYDPASGILVACQQHFIEIKCIAFKQGMLESKVVTKSYEVKKGEGRPQNINAGIIRPDNIRINADYDNENENLLGDDEEGQLQLDLVLASPSGILTTPYNNRNTPSGQTPGYLMREGSQNILMNLSRPGSTNPYHQPKRDHLSDSSSESDL
ncbi:UNKNOWN [Stylonychia lemnae]|uniref:Uncharacterized protein n=1 Tax=Stylonychia lemnae TaxID=5949 RepID=A0A077ZXY7_STYLE|nr:UNKNOWN [Stylonychia lemnae]|eukprot:CDW73396.1 UNKNOWN [Stylonychia lemnae]